MFEFIFLHKCNHFLIFHILQIWVNGLVFSVILILVRYMVSRLSKCIIMQHHPFEVKGRFWIEKQGEAFLGPGRVELLKLVVTEGSINAASKKMGMSYQQAWNTIDRMNRLSPIPVMIPKRGGKNGGGAELTSFGQKMINEVEKLNKAFSTFLSAMNDSLDIGF